MIEVLFSLILLTTIALGLLNQLKEIRHLLNQFILRADAAHFLDEVQEYLLSHVPLTRKTHAPYPLRMKEGPDTLILEVDYFPRQEPLTRQMYKVS